jgi:exosortase
MTLSDTRGTELRHACAIGACVLSLALFWPTWRALTLLSFNDERSSHILLIPLISACLIYFQRSRIFHAPRYDPQIGVPLLLAVAILWFGLQPSLSHLDPTDRLSVHAALIVLIWFAAFLLVYGPVSFKAAMFPLLLLSLTIPIPVSLANGTVFLLQKGSADTCAFLYQILEVPVLRHGFLFSLPGLDIEVAKQCSGIHSALSLFIAGLLAAHLFLHNVGQKFFFTLCIFPIAIFKNAVRIVTISLLAVHVNRAVLEGPLHRHGGLPFSLLSLAMMALLLWMLRRPWLRPALARAKWLNNYGDQPKDHTPVTTP